MRRQPMFFLLMILTALIAGGMLFAQSPKTPAAHAARAGSNATLYLPLILRGCLPAELIQNPSFENGTTPWQISSPRSIVDDTPGIPSPNATHTGLWKAWLGGDNLLQDSLWQEFTVPANASNLRVSFWWRVVTAEPNPLTNDHSSILLRDSSASLLATLYTLYDGDANVDWEQKTIPVIPNYAGQTIQLVFTATTDASFPTHFFVDDVSATVCQ